MSRTPGLDAFILKIVDAFYPLFKKWMPLQLYRYAACGGGNMVLNIFLFFIAYNYIFEKEILHLPFIAISPHIAAFILAFLITFPLGFYLNKVVVFDPSYLRGRTQLFRYFMVVISCIILNYVFLKLFVEVFHWYPTPSMVVNTILVVTYSFFVQKYFTFKQKRI